MRVAFENGAAGEIILIRPNTNSCHMMLVNFMCLGTLVLVLLTFHYNRREPNCNMIYQGEISLMDSF